MKSSLFVGLLLAASAVLASPLEPTVAQMQWQRRVLVIATDQVSDPHYQTQLQAVSGWQGGVDRDVTVVRIEGNVVSGTRDQANDLRSRYQLPAHKFFAILIGKDGHVAARSDSPLAAATLEGLIDAMPMRRAGER